MFCPNCGSQVPDTSRFCPSCGASLGAAAQQEPVQPATPPSPGVPPAPGAAPIPGTPPVPGAAPIQSYAGTAEPSMKWYKFLIYFALFAGALLNVGNAFTAFTGAHYDGSAKYVYAMFGGLQAVDIIYGVVLIGLAVAAIYVRQQLAHFKKGAPKMFLVLYGANAVVGILYLAAVLVIALASVSGYLSAYVDPIDVALEIVPVAQIFLTIIGAAIYLVLNKIYFDKRAHLFTN